MGGTTASGRRLPEAGWFTAGSVLSRTLFHHNADVFVFFFGFWVSLSLHRLTCSLKKRFDDHQKMNLVFFGGFHFPVPGPSDSPCDSTLFVERGEWLPDAAS